MKKFIREEYYYFFYEYVMIMKDHIQPTAIIASLLIRMKNTRVSKAIKELGSRV